MKMGATKKDFESCIGIHPSYSEVIYFIKIGNYNNVVEKG